MILGIVLWVPRYLLLVSNNLQLEALRRTLVKFNEAKIHTFPIYYIASIVVIVVISRK